MTSLIIIILLYLHVGCYTFGDVIITVRRSRVASNPRMAASAFFTEH